MLIIATCLFFFFTNSFILEEVNRLWETPATHYKDLKTYDAGIVLGGMLDYDMTFDRIQFQRGADRLFQAIELYKRGDIKKIFFVGGSGSIEFAGMREGMFVRRYLLTLGILLFSLTVLFQLITLPVEFDASKRAISTLSLGGYLNGEDLDGAKKVLNAAALTYVASALVAIMNLLRLVLLARNRRN